MFCFKIEVEGAGEQGGGGGGGDNSDRLETIEESTKQAIAREGGKLGVMPTSQILAAGDRFGKGDGLDAEFEKADIHHTDQEDVALKYLREAAAKGSEKAKAALAKLEADSSK